MDDSVSETLLTVWTFRVPDNVILFAFMLPFTSNSSLGATLSPNFIPTLPLLVIVITFCVAFMVVPSGFQLNSNLLLSFVPIPQELVVEPSGGGVVLAISKYASPLPSILTLQFELSDLKSPIVS